ncbi:histone-binding protein N1/N2-like isoform X2 [Thalassophryne amazonica]|uniref:histone-binding protein N1/N2-like isoform X2 n=1 Tax=Thalassophryne amazonica TaxID=390379 RepID=UPI0014726219|nr:histone-binding protein N1/N2-like isoform X2 [Thalassophryne amazonica]
MEEANKLLGSGKKHLVMGEVVEAVRLLQEACSILAKTYGDTADECGEAFFWCGKALLDLAQMENSVLGNALEGVPEEDEEKPKDCNVESTENIDEKTRDELRVKVYDAMAEKKTEGNEGSDAENTTDRKLDQAVAEQKADKKTGDVGGNKGAECEDENLEKEAEIQAEPADKEPSEDSAKVNGRKSPGREDDSAEKNHDGSKSPGREDDSAVKDHDGSKSPGREDDSAVKDHDGSKSPGREDDSAVRDHDGSKSPGREDDSAVKDHDGSKSPGREDDSAVKDHDGSKSPGREDDSAVKDHDGSKSPGREDDSAVKDHDGSKSPGREDDSAVKDHDGSKSPGREDDSAVKDHDGSKSPGREDDSAVKDHDGSKSPGREDDSAVKDHDGSKSPGREDDSAVKDHDGSKSPGREDDSAVKGAIDGSSVPESGDKGDGAYEAKDENELLEKQEESVSKPEGAEAGDEEGGEDVEMTSDTEDGEAVEKDSDEEEVGNLQLAWEMLEVAKVIYKRKDTKEDQLMAAQAHLKLGEVSAESGNYTQALEDFQECLKLQLKYLDSDSRLLAETHYQLGLTYSLNCQSSQAVEELNASISVIKSRLDKLQELIDKAEGPEDLPDERKEMEELKALLPEIQEKVEDATEALKTSSSDAEAVKDVLGGGSTSSGVPDSTVKNDDFSSSSVTYCPLRRRPRQLLESPLEPDRPLRFL